MPTDGCMDKQNVVCVCVQIYGRILLSFWKSELRHATHGTDEPYGQSAKGRKPDTEGQTGQDPTSRKHLEGLKADTD